MSDPLANKTDISERPQRRPGWWFPLSGAAFVVIVLSVAALTVAASFMPGDNSAIPLTWPGPFRWATTCAVTHQYWVFTAPALMLWGAWCARARHTLACGGTSPRPYAQIMRRQLLVLVAAGELGYLLGLAPLLVRTTLRATLGHPDWLVLAGGLVGTAMWCALGFAIGALVRYPFSLVVTAVVAAVLLLVGPAVTSIVRFKFHGISVFDGMNALWPFWLGGSSSLQVGQSETWAISLWRLALFVAVIGAVVCCLSTLDRPRRNRRPTPWLLTVCLPLGLVVGVVLVNPRPVVTDPDPPVVCGQSAAGLRVCVYQEVADLLPDVIGLVDSITDRFGSAQFTGTLGPSWNGDASLSVGDPLLPILAGQTALETLFTPSIDPSDPAQGWDCSSPASSEVVNDVSMVIGMRFSPMQYQISQPEQGSVLWRIMQLNDAQLKTWLDGHGNALRACTVTAEDLP